jgi:hypothetical protein
MRVLKVVRARFLLTGALVFSVAAVIAILALTPAFLTTTLPRETLSSVLSSSQDRVKQEEEDRTVTTRTRALLATLAPFTQKKTPVHTVVARVLELSPDEVSIESISYRAGESEGELSIVGTAEGREFVNDYRSALVGEGFFTNVSVPVAALVGASEGNFRMTLTGAF